MPYFQPLTSSYQANVIDVNLMGQSIMRSASGHILSTVGLSAAVVLVAVSVPPTAANASLVCGAGSCTETVSFGGPTDLNNAVLTLDKFTPAANQTLVDVNVSFNGSFFSSGSLTNSSPSTQTFHFSENTDFTFTAGAGAPPSFLTTPFDISGNSGLLPFTLASGASAPVGISFSLPMGSLPTITSDLGGFIGPGMFQTLVSTLTDEEFVGGGGNISASLFSGATPIVTITYDFTVNSGVPEPSTWAMVLLGFTGVGFMAYRRRKSASTFRLV